MQCFFYLCARQGADTGLKGLSVFGYCLFFFSCTRAARAVLFRCGEFACEVEVCGVPDYFVHVKIVGYYRYSFVKEYRFGVMG